MRYCYKSEPVTVDGVRTKKMAVDLMVAEHVKQMLEMYEFFKIQGTAVMNSDTEYRLH